ncbi:12613_t:CDS:2 [Entrophospora sp. SA101]|nr:4906_t:CDS:2 [Entrophospora sp. SA101]CAJ0634182.1 12613_t:CDS:2 [Entrophospora sp. SA101]CAJ0843481.1 10946_t:CDS:2 [Entrophospora sp. SA101]CAJ0901448.1 4736_t:CDS:2 [Entrophospora sp. SA101]
MSNKQLSQVNIDEHKPSYWQLYSFASRKDWCIMIFGLIFSAISGAATPSTTIIFGKMVNSFTEFQTGQISGEDFQKTVNSNTLFFVYLAIITFVATYIYMACWVYTGERITRKIREAYLRAILRQNIAYFDKLGAGEVTTRITSDTHLIQDGISEKVPVAAHYIGEFITAFIIAFVKSWKMTLVICCAVPLIAITSGVMNKFTSVYMKKALDSYSFAGTIAEEVISTIRTAVAFGNQKKLSKLYDVHLGKAKVQGVKKSIVNGTSIGVIYLFLYSTYALAFWFGSTLILSGELASGDVVNVFFAVMIGAFSLGNLAPEIQAFSFAIGASSKIFETINRVPVIDSSSEEGKQLVDGVQGHIELKNISFVYPARPDVQTLDNVSLDIPAGSTVALVGSSGSGKSTIVSLVLRFYDPVMGSITIDGHDIKSFNLKWLRRQMSLVGQEPVLFNTTIAENIAHGLIGSEYEQLNDEKKHEMIETACKMANAHDFIMKLPNKYDTMVGESGFLLSGGQKQRIAIARAIVKNPTILLLDEATSALDTNSEGIVQDALDKASQNRTTIVIAHRLSTIKNATKIIVMDKGVIVESGNHNELMAKEGYYFKLVEAQHITSKTEDSSLLSIPTEKLEEIFPDDVQISRIITNKSNKSASSAIMSKRLADIESGIKRDSDYKTFELIRKVVAINRPELPLVVLGLFGAIVAGSVQPVYAVIFSKIIQAFATTGDELTQEAKFWSLMFLVIAVVTMLANFIQGITFGISGENLTQRIRSQSFAAILHQDISFFDEENHTVGVLTSSLSLDATHVNGLAGATLGTILQVFATIIGGLIVALAVGWKLALVCMATIPLLIGSSLLRMKMLNGFQEKTKKAYEHSAQIACEGTANMRTVAALTREDDLWSIYHHLLDEPMKQGTYNAFYASIAFAVAQSILFFINGLAFWYGSVLFRTGEYDLQKFFTIFVAIIFGSMSAGRVFGFAPDIVKAKSAAASIIALLESKQNIGNDGERVNNIKGHIKFIDVHFRYPTRPHVPVLRGLTLEIKPGQFAALVGPSGCGKSTTIGLTERFYETTIGRIEVDGIDASKMNINDLRSNIALVSQEPSLYDMTIKDNVLFGAREGQSPTQEDVERVCKEANIHDFIKDLPDGYDTYVGSKGAQLSGGQKQRIAIARALIRNPKILLLDEATSALDSGSEKVVQKALDLAAKGRTTLAIAHRLSTVQHADVIFVIKDGKVREQGTHQELLSKNGIYYNMVQEQDLSTNK